ncbi:hypothetical protein GYMLUDRAFT_161073 [Collybiopsis luxurians FD-317 M1]|nr:hypothetical protein GYMLUDRAFT_161073 [Collybiopsis luxurians FD-317 M1]
MTVETCVAFCNSVDYIYAGVEFASVLIIITLDCDSTIQLPSVPTATSDCDNPCAGNASEICGGSESILIYTNGEPAPVIVQDIGNWSYTGCFTDSVGDRVLAAGIDIPAGVTAETCTATCHTAGFAVAGLENAQECWCGNALGNSSIHVGDDECRDVCVADHDEYCGAANRLLVYDFTAAGSPPPPTTCSSENIANFTLTAKLNNPPEGSPSEIPLKIVLVEMVPSVTWAILSVR